MFKGFDKLVEERIKEAQKNGQFDDLQGKGEPLKMANDLHLAPDLRLAHKILKNADFLPPEIELKKDIQRIEDLLAGETDVAQKYHMIKKMNFLIMKVNTLRNTRVDFEIPQYYADKIADKLNTKPT